MSHGQLDQELAGPTDTWEAGSNPKTTDNYAYRSLQSARIEAAARPFQLTGNCRQPSSSAELVTSYADAAHAPNTKRAYQSDLADFHAWGGTVPTDPVQLCRYLAERAQILTPGTLQRRLAAIGDAHRVSGFPDTTVHDQVHRVLRGIGRIHGKRPRQVQPMTPWLLEKVLARFGDAARDKRDRALLLVGYFGALRRSELVALDWVHGRYGANGEIVLVVARSKTDPSGHGREIVLLPSGDGLCPVAALRRWAEIQSTGKGPMFTCGSHRLSDQTVARVVKGRLKAAGFDSKDFSGHSLRSGYVTGRALEGANPGLTARQTGHQSQQQLAAYTRVPQIPRRLD